jgi:hypothetical protein
VLCPDKVADNGNDEGEGNADADADADDADPARPGEAGKKRAIAALPTEWNRPGVLPSVF